MNPNVMNPWVRKFFNLTAGLEKFIIAILAAVQAYIMTIEYFTDAEKTLYVALLAAVQMLYTSNTAPVPAPPVDEQKEPEIKELTTVVGVPVQKDLFS